MNPRIELEKRYPAVDFSVYFRFLDACRGTEKTLDAQEHHICPRKQFPEFIDVFENKVLLTVKQHMLAHEVLHALVPELWAQSKWIAAAAKGGRNSRGGPRFGRWSVESGHLSSLRTSEHQAKAGSVSGKINADSGQLALLRTPANQRAANRAANHKRWHVDREVRSTTCQLCNIGAVTV